MEFYELWAIENGGLLVHSGRVWRVVGRTEVTSSDGVSRRVTIRKDRGGTTSIDEDGKGDIEWLSRATAVV